MAELIQYRSTPQSINLRSGTNVDLTAESDAYGALYSAAESMRQFANKRLAVYAEKEGIEYGVKNVPTLAQLRDIFSDQERVENQVVIDKINGKATNDDVIQDKRQRIEPKNILENLPQGMNVYDIAARSAAGEALADSLKVIAAEKFDAIQLQALSLESSPQEVEDQLQATIVGLSEAFEGLGDPAALRKWRASVSLAANTTYSAYAQNYITVGRQKTEVNFQKTIQAFKSQTKNLLANKDINETVFRKDGRVVNLPEDMSEADRQTVIQENKLEVSNLNAIDFLIAERDNILAKASGIYRDESKLKSIAKDLNDNIKNNIAEYFTDIVYSEEEMRVVAENILTGSFEGLAPYDMELVETARSYGYTDVEEIIADNFIKRLDALDKFDENRRKKEKFDLDDATSDLTNELQIAMGNPDPDARSQMIESSIAVFRSKAPGEPIPAELNKLITTEQGAYAAVDNSEVVNTLNAALKFNEMPLISMSELITYQNDLTEKTFNDYLNLYTAFQNKQISAVDSLVRATLRMAPPTFISLVPDGTRAQNYNIRGEVLKQAQEALFEAKVNQESFNGFLWFQENFERIRSEVPTSTVQPKEQIKSVDQLRERKNVLSSQDELTEPDKKELAEINEQLKEFADRKKETKDE